MTKRREPYRKDPNYEGLVVQSGEQPVEDVERRKKRRCKGASGPWCWMMAWRLNEANSRRAGLTPLVVTNQLLEHRTVAVVHKMSRVDNGLVLNFCPWCGADIKFQTPKDKVNALVRKRAAERAARR